MRSDAHNEPQSQFQRKKIQLNSRTERQFSRDFGNVLSNSALSFSIRNGTSAMRRRIYEKAMGNKHLAGFKNNPNRLKTENRGQPLLTPQTNQTHENPASVQASRNAPTNPGNSHTALKGNVHVRIKHRPKRPHRLNAHLVDNSNCDLLSPITEL
jgi:hypothetical protein